MSQFTLPHASEDNLEVSQMQVRLHHVESRISTSQFLVFKSVLFGQTLDDQTSPYRFV